MIFQIIALLGFITMPIWGIVFCLNLVSIIENIKYEEAYQKNTIWLTISFVIIITVIAYFALV
jgi:hypothetical protein